MTRLADRQIEIVLRNRVHFGVGAIERLPEVVAAAGGSRVFVVTDPGVRGSGVIERVLGVLAAAGLETAVFAEVEPNPGASTVERGAAALRGFGLSGTVVVPVGGGSSMDTAKALDLRATNDLAVWDLEYDGPDLTPGRPVVAVPTTAGTGAETNSFAVITDEAAGRKGYIGHPSLLPVATILDPALTVGLPPAATAATGIDAMTHSLESLLSANPNPFAEAMALGVIRTIGDVASGRPSPTARTSRRARRCCSPRTWPGWARRAGPASGWSTRWAIRSGRVAASPHGTALAVVLPEVLRFYLGVRDRELALVGIALGVASGAEAGATGAAAAIGAIEQLLRDVDQRPTPALARLRRGAAWTIGRPGRARRRRDPQLATPPDARRGARRSSPRSLRLTADGRSAGPRR